MIKNIILKINGFLKEQNSFLFFVLIKGSSVENYNRAARKGVFFCLGLKKQCNVHVIIIIM